MSQSTPIVINGRILFPEGTDSNKVRSESCPNCPHGFDCEGPKSAGGSIFADNHQSKTSDEKIAETASCHPRIRKES